MTNHVQNDQPRRTIIRATPEHAEIASPLFDAYRQFYGQASDLDGAKAFLSERLLRGESVVLLAIANEFPHPLGFTQLYPLFSSITMQRIFVLNDLFVLPSARGSGVGRLLLAAAEDHARSTGAKGLTLSTARDNHGAQALYVSCGYVLDEKFLSYHLTFSQPGILGGCDRMTGAV